MRLCARGLSLMMLAATLWLVGCATLGAQRPQPVTVVEVLQMSKAGVPAEIMIQRMRESGAVYRLSAADLVRLHEEGVPDDVLNYMQQTYLDAVRREQELADWNRWALGPDGYWYGGWGYGWPSRRWGFGVGGLILR
jgi:hypothetical protein